MIHEWKFFSYLVTLIEFVFLLKVNVQQEMVQDMNKMETMSLMATYGSEYE